MNEWQPMATAPKDGTDVLVYFGGLMGTVEIAFWADELQSWVNRPQSLAFPTVKCWGWMPCPPDLLAPLEQVQEGERE